MVTASNKWHRGNTGSYHTVLHAGAILTKMDGDSRGGAALSVRDVSGKPIKFVGVGEKLEALEPFYPERMAQRILGMGDMLTLYEKAQEAIKVGQLQFSGISVSLYY